MEDQLISFEVAKLAKSKGFNEPTDPAYGTEGVLYFQHDGEEYPNSDLLELFYSAPTQSLLQKWLREVHNLAIEINAPDSQDEKWSCQLHIPYKFGNLFNNSVEGNTYEDALEEGLQAALNLIK